VGEERCHYTVELPQVATDAEWNEVTRKFNEVFRKKNQ